MELVGPRLGDRVDDRAQCLTVLGRVVMLKHLNFLNAVHADAVDAGFDTPEHVRRAVEVNASGIDTVDKDARAAERRRDAIDAGLKLVGGLHRTGHGGEELRKVAAVDRVVLDPTRPDSVADGCGFGIYALFDRPLSQPR